MRGWGAVVNFTPYQIIVTTYYKKLCFYYRFNVENGESKCKVFPPPRFAPSVTEISAYPFNALVKKFAFVLGVVLIASLYMTLIKSLFVS